MSATVGDFAKPTKCRCYAAKTARGSFEPFEITRRACGPNDVVIDIKYAGICHSDIHQAREEWGPATFPMVPGHEIAGHAVAIGSEVKGFSIGDTVGVGCMVDSCRKCASCLAGEENYCLNGSIMTYNGKYKYDHCQEYDENGGALTYGGYSKLVVVDKSYVLKIPSNLTFSGTAPLLCAGITLFSPMKYYGLQPSHRFAVVGLGGLGHMGVKLGKAFGCHTTVISRGTTKKADALEGLKADSFIDSTSAEAFAAAAGTFDFIIDTVSANHDIAAILNLLTTNGKLIMVGAPPDNFSVNAFPLLMKRRMIAGSLIGGIPQTQEMLDFCGKHNITCDVEIINASQIDAAYNRTVAGDTKVDSVRNGPVCAKYTSIASVKLSHCREEHYLLNLSAIRNRPYSLMTHMKFYFLIQNSGIVQTQIHLRTVMLFC
eukprot:gene6211-12581_t